MIKENDLEKFSLKARQKAQLRDDFNNEIAGREVGRVSRFLNAESRDAKAVSKREERQKAELTALQLMMMNDPEYAALYRETEEVLQRTQGRLDTALDTVRSAKSEAEEVMLDIMTRAARLPDGRHVFHDQDGNVRFEDGTAVDSGLASSIVWTGAEPKLEDLQVAAKRVTELSELESDIHAGQAEIGEMQERMADQRDPTTKDDMSGFQNRAGELADTVDERLELLSERELTGTENEMAMRPQLDVTVPKL